MELNLRELEPERFWQKTVSTAEARKKNAIETKMRIMSDKYLASIKKDGEYQRFVKQDGTSTLQGRGLSTVTGEYVDNSGKMPIVLKFLDENFDEGTCFLGEAYMPNKTSKDVRGVLGCLPAKAIVRDAKTPVYYYIFDIWALNGKLLFDVEFQDRVNILKGLTPKLIQCDRIQVAEYVSGGENILNLIEQSFINDEEGVVLSLKSSLPAPGKRTAWKTMKIKKEFANDIDVFFTGNVRPATRLYTGKELADWLYWENIKTGVKSNNFPHYKAYIAGETYEPITKLYYEGVPASFEIAVYNNITNSIISLGYVSSGITDAIRRDYLQNKEKFIKRPALIQGMEFTEDGQIRHPKFLQFRDSTISWKECSFDKLPK